MIRVITRDGFPLFDRRRIEFLIVHAALAVEDSISLCFIICQAREILVRKIQVVGAPRALLPDSGEFLHGIPAAKWVRDECVVSPQKKNFHEYSGLRRGDNSGRFGSKPLIPREQERIESQKAQAFRFPLHRARARAAG